MVNKVIPALTGRDGLDEHHLNLLRLPARLGGMGIPCFTRIAPFEFKASKEVTRLQVDAIVNMTQQTKSPREVHADAISAQHAIRVRRRNADTLLYQDTFANAPEAGQRRLSQLSIKGVSSWLTTLPLRQHGFHLSRRDFQDALALRYDWPPAEVPSTCVCAAPFTTAHAMVCPRGGFPTVRHNEVRDILGDLLTEVCRDVAVEPQLAPLSGERFAASSTNTSPEARVDLRARGFWTRAENAFFDVRVFHADSASYRHQTPDALLELHERQKKAEYAERVVNVDRGSFCPLVFATAGYASKECTRFLKRLAGMVARHDGQEYPATLNYIRCRISVALTRASIMCLRGSRSAYHRPINSLRPLAVAECSH